MIQTAQEANVLEFKRIADLALLTDPLVHHVHESLVDTHAFLRQVRGVVDWDVI